MDRAAGAPFGIDNARGGQRDLRATPSDPLLAAIRRAYAIGEGPDPVDLGGSSNLNLLVGVGDDRYVVRVYRPHVTMDRLHAMQVVCHVLARVGVPCAPPMPTREGRSSLVFADRLVEVERFVAWDAVMDTWERLETGMVMLGRLHSVLRDLQVGTTGLLPRFANHLDATDVLDRTRAGVRRIRDWHPTPIEIALADDAEALARAVARAERPFAGTVYAPWMNTRASLLRWDEGIRPSPGRRPAARAGLR